MADGHRLRTDLCVAAGQEPDDRSGLTALLPTGVQEQPNATLCSLNTSDPNNGLSRRDLRSRTPVLCQNATLLKWGLYRLVDRASLDIATISANLIPSSMAERADRKRLRAFLKRIEPMGFVGVKVATVQDERVCPDCSAVEGKVFSVKDALKQNPIPGRRCGPDGCRCVYMAKV